MLTTVRETTLYGHAIQTDLDGYVQLHRWCGGLTPHDRCALRAYVAQKNETLRASALRAGLQLCGHARTLCEGEQRLVAAPTHGGRVLECAAAMQEAAAVYRAVCRVAGELARREAGDVGFVLADGGDAVQ